MKSHGFRLFLTRTLIVKLPVALIMTLVMSLLEFNSAPAWAASAREASSDNEYSFQWLDPDKKIYVLQNRKYEKANRLLFSVMGGPAHANAYRKTLSLDGRVAFYLSEMFGIEAFYGVSKNSENSTFEALKNASGSAPKPVIREPDAMMGLLVHYVPWYAKINVFNNILYFDWYFSGGAGRMQSTLVDEAASGTTRTKEDLTTFFLGTGHQYHLSQSLTVRIDLTVSFYQAPIYGTSGENTWFNNFNFNFGLGFRL